MKKVLFVCTGNTCRSPMAEIIFKNKLKLAGVTGVRVSSAGINALDGEKMSENSCLALKKLGYKPYGFKSKQLTEKMLKSSDAVICMTKEHKNCLAGYGNVKTVNEITLLGDIPDPYGQDLNAYMKTSRALEDACMVLLKAFL